MGMRAVIAYKDTKGMTTVITNQWSTAIHNVLPTIVDHIVQAEGVTEVQAATSIFDKLADNCIHIGSINVLDEAVMNEKDSFYFNKDTDLVVSQHNGEIGVVSRYLPIANTFGEQQETYIDDVNLAELVKNHDHAQDGLSVWFDANNPQYIHVWIDPEYDYMFEEEGGYTKAIPLSN